MAPIQTSLTGELNDKIPAIIRRVDLIADSLTWYNQWFPKMFDMSMARLFDDSHWPVPLIWEEADNDDNQRVLILEAQNNIQGYSVIQVNGYLGTDQVPCTYVAFLASAPWNRQSKGEKPDLKGVGTQLLAASLIYGFRHTNNFILELHSLPSAEGFYRKIGMWDTGKVKNTMKLFRMERPEALKLLRPLLPSIMRKEVRI